ncbi:site-specific integrase, partial [Shinella sp. BE166]|uniref:site-specific integrase n=1 Tax=Shinella sp. BE166 TaxID=3373918 RepID=UPI003EC0CA84
SSEIDICPSPLSRLNIDNHKLIRKVGSGRRLQYKLKTAATERDSAFKREVNNVYSSFINTQAMILETFHRRRETETLNPDPILPGLEALSAKIASLNSAVEIMLDGGRPGPLLSVALEDWFSVRSGLGIDQKKIDTDYNRVKDFIGFSGDKPINKYRFLDFQSFANLLARVPASYSVKPEFRGMTQVQAVFHNDNLPLHKQHKTLTGKTIETNYLSPLNMIFHDMCAHHGFTSPLANVTVRISADARDSTARLPFEVAELNRWFAFAALEDRGDNKWLPLLGTVTGARVGELIPLQRKDIYQVEGGHWVLDLTTDLTDIEGLPVARRIKNKSSRRIIAIHQSIVDAGFIDYVKSFPKDGRIFPWAFHHGKKAVKRPADAASKRLNAQLKKVGIHKEIESTFHSTRHTAKDIMRVAKIDQRTHDKQTGHALKTVSDNYGAKTLKREELEVLAVLPLPEGLDLSPYLAVR